MKTILRHRRLSKYIYLGGSYCALEIDTYKYAYQFWCYGAVNFRFFHRLQLRGFGGKFE